MSGVKLADLLKETGSAEVQIGESKVGLVYRLMWEEEFSDDDWERVKALPGRAYFIEILPRLLVSWELLDARGKPIPVTADAIRKNKIPTRFLRLCEQAVLEAQNAPKGSSNN